LDDQTSESRGGHVNLSTLTDRQSELYRFIYHAIAKTGVLSGWAVEIQASGWVLVWRDCDGLYEAHKGGYQGMSVPPYHVVPEGAPLPGEWFYD